MRVPLASETRRCPFISPFLVSGHPTVATARIEEIPNLLRIDSPEGPGPGGSDHPQRGGRDQASPGGPESEQPVRQQPKLSPQTTPSARAACRIAEGVRTLKLVVAAHWNRAEQIMRGQGESLLLIAHCESADAIARRSRLSSFAVASTT
jgi:hypothetical protein